MTHPRTSIVMTAFNSARFIGAAIDSVLAQSDPDFEFIIVDDASVDETPAIVAQAAAKDKRIISIRNSINLRPSKSANHAISIARGRYIARMDSDDVAHIDRIRRQADFLDKNDSFVAVGCAYQEIDAAGALRSQTQESTTALEARWMSLFRMPVIHPGAMFRQETALGLEELYDDAFDGAADFEFFQRLIAQGDICALPDVLMQYRVHGDNVSIQKRDRQRDASNRAVCNNLPRALPRLRTEAGKSAADFIYGAGSGNDRSSIRNAALAMSEIEAVFSQTHGLTMLQRLRIRMLSARWLAAAALERGMLKDPAACVRFAWGARSHTLAFAQETGGYAMRRFPALMASRGQ